MVCDVIENCRCYAYKGEVGTILWCEERSQSLTVSYQTVAQVDVLMMDPENHSDT